MLFITKQEPQSKHLAKKAVTYKASRITKIKAKNKQSNDPKKERQQNYRLEYTFPRN